MWRQQRTLTAISPRRSSRFCSSLMEQISTVREYSWTLIRFVVDQCHLARVLLKATSRPFVAIEAWNEDLSVAEGNMWVILDLTWPLMACNFNPDCSFLVLFLLHDTGKMANSHIFRIFMNSRVFSLASIRLSINLKYRLFKFLIMILVIVPIRFFIRFFSFISMNQWISFEMACVIRRFHAGSVTPELRKFRRNRNSGMPVLRGFSRFGRGICTQKVWKPWGCPQDANSHGFHLTQAPGSWALSDSHYPLSAFYMIQPLYCLWETFDVIKRPLLLGRNGLRGMRTKVHGTCVDDKHRRITNRTSLSGYGIDSGYGLKGKISVTGRFDNSGTVFDMVGLMGNWVWGHQFGR